MIFKQKENNFCDFLTLKYGFTFVTLVNIGMIKNQFWAF